MKFPALHEINNKLAFLVLISLILYFGSFILIPIVFSTLLAMLMIPLAHYLEKQRVPTLLSALTCTLVVCIGISLFVYFIGTEISAFVKQIPVINNELKALSKDVQYFIYSVLNISKERQVWFVKTQAQPFISYFTGILTGLISKIYLTLWNALLVFILVFLFILRRERYKNFILSMIPKRHPEQQDLLLSRIGRVTGLYLRGRVISIAAITLFYTIGLTVAGIDNAFLLAVFAAAFSIVPYIGTFIGSLFPILMTLVTETGWLPALLVILILIVGQLIDDYFIEPVFVGGQVDLNAASVLLILVVGGYFWGIAGMILFIPLLAIVKIICDETETLKPWGQLLGRTGKFKSKN